MENAISYPVDTGISTVEAKKIVSVKPANLRYEPREIASLSIAELKGVLRFSTAKQGEEGAGEVESLAEEPKKWSGMDKEALQQMVKDITEDPNEIANLVAKADMLIDDELFQPPPPKEECPICFLPLKDVSQVKYQECCGKRLCTGCYMVGMKREQSQILFSHLGIGKRPLCPFCNTPEPKSNQEAIARLKKRCKLDDANACHVLGSYYRFGELDLVQDIDKGFELLFRGAELGSVDAHQNIAYAYDSGEGLEQDAQKAVHHYQISAMGGNLNSRHNLGNMEATALNYKRAVKHWMIAASAGFDFSLDFVKKGYKSGYVTKDEYAKVLRAHHEASAEMKSGNRAAAPAARRTERKVGEATIKERLQTRAALRPVPATAGTPTPCVELRNMIRESLEDDAQYEVLLRDTLDNCMSFGALQKVIIPRSGPGTAKIFLEYSTVEEAGRVIAALGSIGHIEAVYCDPECLSMHNWFMSIQSFATQQLICEKWEGM